MKSLELIFKTADNRTVRLSLQDPVDPVDEVALQAAMDSILAADVFVSNGYSWVAKAGARLVERNVTDIELVV